MEKLCARYLNEYAVGKKSAAGDRWMIDHYVLPAIGTKTATAIRFADVQKLHRSMAVTPYQANRVLSLLSTIFNLAEKWEIRPRGTNPCEGVKRFAEKKRVRFLTDDEIRRLVLRLEIAFAELPIQAGMLLMLLYTGARYGEMAAARWDQVSGSELHLPDSKTGQKVVFLTPQAMNVLARMPRYGDFIFGEATLRYLWANILEEAKLKNLRIHDLRHCFASVGISAGESLARVGGLLGHSNPKQTAVYAHLVPSEGRAAAQAIGARFDRIQNASA